MIKGFADWDMESGWCKVSAVV